VEDFLLEELLFFYNVVNPADPRKARWLSPILNFIIVMPALSKWSFKLEPRIGMRIGVQMTIYYLIKLKVFWPNWFGMRNV